MSYSHPFVGTALYNLIFTNVCDPCQKHIIDGPPDACTAILTLRRHCAPLTPDHVERTREAFCSIKQPHHEVATSYLNRIRILTRGDGALVALFENKYRLQRLMSDEPELTLEPILASGEAH